MRMVYLYQFGLSKLSLFLSFKSAVQRFKRRNLTKMKRNTNNQRTDQRRHHRLHKSAIPEKGRGKVQQISEERQREKSRTPAAEMAYGEKKCGLARKLPGPTDRKTRYQAKGRAGLSGIARALLASKYLFLMAMGRPTAVIFSKACILLKKL
jgi:hypothetical protein